MASLSKTELLVIKDCTGLLLRPDGKPKPQVSTRVSLRALSCVTLHTSWQCRSALACLQGQH